MLQSRASSCIKGRAYLLVNLYCIKKVHWGPTHEDSLYSRTPSIPLRTGSTSSAQSSDSTQECDSRSQEGKETSDECQQYKIISKQD
jgi:hypothetical protein